MRLVVAPYLWVHPLMSIKMILGYWIVLAFRRMGHRPICLDLRSDNDGKDPVHR